MARRNGQKGVGARGSGTRATGTGQNASGNHPTTSATTRVTYTNDVNFGNIRRPTTTDESKYFHCSPETWDAWKHQAKSSDQKESHGALDRLRKFSFAGYLNETDEGRDAPNPCQQCINRGVACKVKKDAKFKCAFCRCKSRGGCTANAQHGTAPTVQAPNPTSPRTATNGVVPQEDVDDTMVENTNNDELAEPDASGATDGLARRINLVYEEDAEFFSAYDSQAPVVNSPYDYEPDHDGPYYYGLGSRSRA